MKTSKHNTPIPKARGKQGKSRGIVDSQVLHFSKVAKEKIEEYPPRDMIYVICDKSKANAKYTRS